MKSGTCGFALAVLFATTMFGADLQKDLNGMAAQHAGKVALYAKNLKTGATVAVNADEPVQTASVIKLPVMIEAFCEAAAGKVQLEERLKLAKENQVPGSGVLAQLQPGLEPTLGDAITLMIIISDNTATNMVLDRIGIPPVNARIAAMGLKNTYLYKKVFTPAEGPMPADQKKFGLGKTTAREMAEVMESILRCDLKNEGLCARMLAILRAQQDQSMIPRYITTGEKGLAASIGDKVGKLDAVRNDVALVTTKAGPIVISIFTWENKDQRWTPDNEAEILIGRMAKRVVDEWTQ
ncbi:MAG: serine hydrolase [Terriglobales bacterium]